MKVLEFVAAHPIISLILVGKAGSVATSIVETVCRNTCDAISILRTGSDPRIAYTKTTTFDNETITTDTEITNTEYLNDRKSSELEKSINDAVNKISKEIVKLTETEEEPENETELENDVECVEEE